MTVKEALQSMVSYPIDDGSFDRVIAEQGLVCSDLYDPLNVTNQKRGVDLSFAKLINVILLSPQSISEGGYTINMGDRKNLISLQNSIYRQYGVENTSRLTMRARNLW